MTFDWILGVFWGGKSILNHYIFQINIQELQDLYILYVNLKFRLKIFLCLIIYLAYRHNNCSMTDWTLVFKYSSYVLIVNLRFRDFINILYTTFSVKLFSTDKRVRALWVLPKSLKKFPILFGKRKYSRGNKQAFSIITSYNSLFLNGNR